MKNVYLSKSLSCFSGKRILAWGSLPNGKCDYITSHSIERIKELVAQYDEQCRRQGGQIMIETRQLSRGQKEA